MARRVNEMQGAIRPGGRDGAAPVLTPATRTLTLAENTVNASPQLFVGDVSFADADEDFDGGAVIVDGVLDEDEVSVRHQGMAGGEIGFDTDTGEVFYGGVLIGVATGGCGCIPFTVDLNPNATSAAVEALLENLTYANLSDTPTPNRELTVVVFDAAGEATLGGARQYAPGVAPSAGDVLDSLPVYAQSLADIDGDGDLDLLVQADYGGSTTHILFENIGDATAPMWDPVALDPFGGLLADPQLSSRFVDIDGDGDLDLVSQSYYGDTVLLRADGVGGFAVEADPADDHIPDDLDGVLEFADLDGDGDLDMIAGAYGSTARFLENLGGGDFAERSGAANPFAALGLEDPLALRLGDVDGDGDLDLLVGDYSADAYGFARYFENVGDATTPQFSERFGYGNPFFLFPNFAVSSVSLDDLDGDGFADMTVASSGSPLSVYGNEAGPGLSIELNVTPEDDAATVGDDAVSVGETGVLTGDLFADNGDGVDSDPDGGPVVTAVNGAPASVGVPVLLASGALLTVNADGTFGYNPNGAFDLAGPGSGAANATATDSFSYTLSGGEVGTVTVTIQGEDGADLVLGTAGDDSLSGGLFNDRVQGGAGDDILSGGFGADVLEGGDGFDLVSYADAPRRVVVRLWNHTAAQGHGAGDDLSGFEGAIGSAFGDALIGSDGDDSLSGGGGDDLVHGGDGADALDGGFGVGDTLDYRGSDAGVTVRLSDGFAAGGDADGDVISGFENLDGSGHADSLGGDGGANRIGGGDGDDVIEGGGGADTLSGGAGIDTLSYASSHAGVQVRLWNGAGNRGHANGDVVSGFENLQGSGFNDTLIGSSRANRILGGDGDDLLAGGRGQDHLEGGAGDDRLIGGFHDDRMLGGAGDDRFIFEGSAWGDDTIEDFEAGVPLGDVIQFSTTLFADYADLLTAAYDDGAGNTVIERGAARLVLLGVETADLFENDFQFVGLGPGSPFDPAAAPPQPDGDPPVPVEPRVPPEPELKPGPEWADARLAPDPDLPPLGLPMADPSLTWAEEMGRPLHRLVDGGGPDWIW